MRLAWYSSRRSHKFSRIGVGNCPFRNVIKVGPTGITARSRSLLCHFRQSRTDDSLGLSAANYPALDRHPLSFLQRRYGNRNRSNDYWLHRGDYGSRNVVVWTRYFPWTL